MVARLRDRGTEVGLREYLLEQAIDFRALYGASVAEWWETLTGPVDRLVGGEACQLRRYELPTGHPLSSAGDACDCLVLTEDDCLVAYEDFLGEG